MGCAAPISTQDQTQALSIKCFAVECMDFRLVNNTVSYLDSIGLHKNYDNFVLAGASLGFTQDKYPEWGKTLLAHMSIGESLHHFRQIIFVDHRDCGAFRMFYPEINAQNEVELHTKHMQMAHDKLAASFPSFSFRGFLMDIEGNCIELPIVDNAKIDRSKVKEDQFLSSLKLINQ